MFNGLSIIPRRLGSPGSNPGVATHQIRYHRYFPLGATTLWPDSSATRIRRGAEFGNLGIGSRSGNGGGKTAGEQ